MPSRVAAVVAAAAVMAGAAFADTGRKQIKLTAADQAAARAALVRRSDLPGTPWLGGRDKPDLSQASAPACRDYRPKLSDVVLTGIAESSFTRRDGRWYVNSAVQMVRTARMLRLDWQRVVVAPGAIRCHRRDIAKTISRNGRLVSFGRIPFPHLTRYAVEYRAVVYVPAGNTDAGRWLVDAVLVGAGRTEMSLDVLARTRTRVVTDALERRLARTMVSRARSSS
jgi:hypothetical protein